MPPSGSDNFFKENQDHWDQWKYEKEREQEEARFNYNEYEKYVGDLGRTNLAKAEHIKQLKRVELMMEK